MTRILIAADEWPTGLEIEEMLTGLGYEVAGRAESGREAVDMARDLKPDLILMDLAMSGETSGIDAATKIKVELDIPIIFISNYGEPDSIEAAKQANPSGHRMKPFGEKQMRASVEIALDISRRKQAEKGLRISRERLMQIINFLPDATFVIDTEGKVVAWNHAIEKMTGIRARDMLGKGDFEYAVPFYGKRRPILIDLVSRWDKEAEAAYNYVKKEGEALVSETYNCLVKPGGTLWNKASLLYAENGEVTGAIESIRDITERKAYEEALRESEERYHSLFEQVKSAIVLTTRRGDLVDANTYALDLFGYTKEEMMTVNFQRLYVNPDDGHRFRKEMEESGSVQEFSARLRRSDGLEMDCRMDVVNRHGEMGKIIGYQGIIRDVTESNRLQMQLQEAKKTEAIATLAGGIAHQFNNALTPIIGNLDLLEMEYGQDDKMMKALKHMKASGRRMAHLTRQLLAYAREGKYQARVLSLPGFVLGTIPLIEHTLKPDVHVETDLSEDLSYIRADTTQMQMVLSALISNANEAMEGPGRIRIGARNMDLDARFVKDHPGLDPGTYVCLSVEDTGKGMDKETQDRIFDPFFTTHFLGRGLGMAAVYGIVRNHGGVIKVDSAPGRGTLVRIYLPAVSPERREQGARDGKASGVETIGDEKTVLVIEDEELVMDMTQTMLGMLGYRVLKAATGKEAVHTARTFEGGIDFALLDIKLPDMSGIQVYPLIMAARPDLKVVVCSGYSIDGPAREILNSGAHGFIQKPFSLEALNDKLRQVLKKQ